MFFGFVHLYKMPVTSVDPVYPVYEVSNNLLKKVQQGRDKPDNIFN